MIAFVRTANIAPGKTAAAIGFAHEIAGHMKQTYGVELELLRPVGGNPQRIAWSARYADLAAMGEVNNKIMADKRYWEMVGKASDCFLAGSINDAIWQTL